MRLFFIDYENAGTSGVRGIGSIGCDDKVFLFYTSNSCTLDFDLFSELKGVGDRLKLISVATGKNSLDFQLSTFLGFIIAKNPDTEFFIVSKDKGFENVSKFWKGRQVNVSIIDDMRYTGLNKISDVLKNLPACQENSQQIADIIEKCQSRQDFNNSLMRSLGTEKAGIIYRAVKPYFSEFGIVQ